MHWTLARPVGRGTVLLDSVAWEVLTWPEWVIVACGVVALAGMIAYLTAARFRCNPRPYAKRPARPVGAGSAGDRVERRNPRGVASVSAPCVLVVGDDLQFRSVMRELLELRGYRVVGEAARAASALEAVASLTPDAVLLDVGLGDDSGFALARRLARRAPAPAVLITSSSDAGDGHERARASGARGFVHQAEVGRTDFGQFWL